MGDVLEIINSVGFPITVSVALFYQNIKTQDTIMLSFREFKSVIEQNNETLTNLENAINKLGGER